MRWTIKEQECGYLMKNGRFQKLLTAGRYTYLKQLGYDVTVVPMTGPVNMAGLPADVLMACPDFAKRVVKAQLPDTSIAIRFVNGTFREVLTRPENYFWNVFEQNEFQLLDITKQNMEEVLPRMYMELMPAKYYKKIVVKDGELGLLYVDNRLERQLGTGTYYFWNYGAEVSCKIFNMKLQQLEISGQEVLTADKVGVRLNVICGYRITDPERLVQQIEGVSAQLYTCAQLIIREYVGRFKLDELLAQKEEIGRYILEKMRERQEALCVEVVNGGIKDIILPGEIRDIMNTVLVAEKKAQANVIMRREEVASTRSLLNTAKMM
ncbi:MAG: slipin family protein, partial [Lachnospiraceae bacterium]|nr:slipin family protein [Lachnospiraceae bacterium]